MTKRRFQIPQLNDQNLSIDIPLDNFVKSGAVHDYKQSVAATYAVTAATPTFPGFLFNGSSAEIVASVDTVANFQADDFTLSAWIKPSADTNIIMAKWLAGAAQRAWTFGLDAASKIYLITESGVGTGTTATSTNALTLNTWNHVAVTKAGTGANDTAFYLNGVANGTGQVEDCRNTTKLFRIGADEDGNFFTGKISGVRIYQPKVLSAAEMLSLYSLTRWRYGV